MLSVDWLDNFNANLVCISATKVQNFIEDLFSLFVGVKLLKLRSTGAFEQGKEAMTDAKMIRLLYFLSPFGLCNSLILEEYKFFIRNSKIEAQADYSQFFQNFKA